LNDFILDIFGFRKTSDFLDILVVLFFNFSIINLPNSSGSKERKSIYPIVGKMPGISVSSNLAGKIYSPFF